MEYKYIKTKIREIQRSFYYKLLNIHILSCGQGICELCFPVQDNAFNSGGNISSGVLTTASEMAIYIALYTMIPKEAVPLIISIDTSMTIPINIGEVHINSRIIKLEDGICFAEADVMDQNNISVAFSYFTLQIVE
jgi:acyl-coenzyme A thioesterase PaaI-like protein